jgi:hypothetical protein
MKFQLVVAGGSAAAIVGGIKLCELLAIANYQKQRCCNATAPNAAATLLGGFNLHW